MIKIFYFLLVLFFLSFNRYNLFCEDKTKLITKLDSLFLNSPGKNSICDRSFEVLEILNIFEHEKEFFTTGRSELNRIKYDIYILKSVCYFCLTKTYLIDNSYAYGIQVLEKGIDNLKEVVALYRKDYFNDSYLENNTRSLKKLYDECFNIYSEYKMYKINNPGYEVMIALSKYLDEMKNLTINEWIIKHLTQ